MRIVPGGTAVRRGAHVARGVVIMPPAYVNVGAFVGDGTMIDSHALVGSCAQIGAARAPLGRRADRRRARARRRAAGDRRGRRASSAGTAASTRACSCARGAVLAAGVVLTAATSSSTSCTSASCAGRATSRSRSPSGAVVVPGSRPLRATFARRSAASAVPAPLIVKYRDEKTDRATALEDALALRGCGKARPTCSGTSSRAAGLRCSARGHSVRPSRSAPKSSSPAAAGLGWPWSRAKNEGPGADVRRPGLISERG